MARKRSSKKSPPLDETLAQSSREELIEIIKAVIKRDPTMQELVDLAMAAPKPGKPMNVSAYRQQARRTMEIESPEAIENGLMNLRDAAARLAKSGDWLNAGASYHVALDEAVAGYDDLVQSMDRDGEISVVMDDLAEGLGKALEKSRADAKTRWDWIETLLEALLADIELGGIELAPSAGEAVLKLATARPRKRSRRSGKPSSILRPSSPTNRCARSAANRADGMRCARTRSRNWRAKRNSAR